LSLQQIAEETKIPRRHLVSLEHGDLSVIPGSTYRRGEVVAYAKAVGLNPAVALSELERVSQPSMPDKPVMPTESRSQRTHVRGALIATAAVLGALTVGSLLWKQPVSEVTNSSSPSLANNAAESRGATTANNQNATNPSSAEVTTAPRQSSDVAYAALNVPSSSDIAPPSSRPTTNGQPVLDPDSQSPRDEAIAREQTTASAVPVPSAPMSDETSLAIITEPAGARVTVNEIGWGTTPVTIRNLPPGTKQIRVTKDGYTAAVRTTRVVEGRAATLTIPLSSVSAPPKTP
jgi:cytoskeletal protein RodZ